MFCTISKKDFRSSSILFFVRLFFMMVFVFGFFSRAEAANLRTYPSKGNYLTGESFSISILLQSSDQAVNAVTGRLVFSPEYLSVTSLSKDSSIFDFWVHNPSFSNELGNVNFEGAIFNPGFQGDQAKILTVNFKVKKAGPTNIYLDNVLIYANDGLGTNVLEKTNGSNFFLIKSGTALVDDLSLTVNKSENSSNSSTTSNKVSSSSVNMVPVALSHSTSTSLTPPTITNYTKEIVEGDVLKIWGFTYPTSTVLILLQNDSGETTVSSYSSDKNGDFMAEWTKQLKAGKYTFAAVVNSQSVKSPISDYLPLVIKDKTLFEVVGFSMTWINLLYSLISIIILLLISNIYLLRELIKNKKKVKKEISLTKEDLKKIKNAENLNGEIQMVADFLQSASLHRKLSSEEETILKKFKKYIKPKN